MDRKELVQTYYNEALEKFLKIYIEGKVNQETVEELDSTWKM